MAQRQHGCVRRDTAALGKAVPVGELPGVVQCVGGLRRFLFLGAVQRGTAFAGESEGSLGRTSSVARDAPAQPGASQLEGSLLRAFIG